MGSAFKGGSGLGFLNEPVALDAEAGSLLSWASVSECRLSDVCWTHFLVFRELFKGLDPSARLTDSPLYSTT